MTLKEIVERLEAMERMKSADAYDNHRRLIDDVERLRLDIEMYLTTHDPWRSADDDDETA